MGVEGDYLGMPLRIEALDQLWTLDETATSVRPFGDISRCLSTCTGRPYFGQILCAATMHESACTGCRVWAYH
jgi:hypothetical protein